MYYLCTYGLYYALEEPENVCCAYGPSENHGSAVDNEGDVTDNAIVSNVKSSKLVS